MYGDAWRCVELQRDSWRRVEMHYMTDGDGKEGREEGREGKERGRQQGRRGRDKKVQLRGSSVCLGSYKETNLQKQPTSLLKSNQPLSVWLFLGLSVRISG